MRDDAAGPAKLLSFLALLFRYRCCRRPLAKPTSRFYHRSWAHTRAESRQSYQAIALMIQNYRANESAMVAELRVRWVMVSSHLTDKINLFDENGELATPFPHDSGLARAITIKMITR